MTKYVELAAPVHPFLATSSSEHVSGGEPFVSHNNNNNALPWQFNRNSDFNHNNDFQPESAPVFDDPWSLYHTHHHQQERIRSESLNDDHLYSSETLSPAASFLSTFLSSPTAASSLPKPSEQSVAGYILGHTIGRGGFSVIKEGRSPSGDIVAIKIVRRSAFDNLPPTQRRRQKSRFTHEARVWASLSHENILPLFHCHHTTDVTYLITLYCPAGSLFDILKREGTPALEQTDAGCMFRQVVKGLRYMHETMCLVHCDVKLENVLVDESGVCRLTDFGLTKRIGGDPCMYSSDEEEEGEEEDDDDEPDYINPRTLAKSDAASSLKQRSRSRGRAGSTTIPVHLSLRRHGPSARLNRAGRPRHATETLVVPKLPDYSFPPGSLQYASPELLLPRSPSTSAQQDQGRYTAHPAQDMWALGVLLYALLTGRLPFRDSFEPRLQMKIVKGTFDIPLGIGTHAEAVLKGCLHKDVSQRWNISMVEDAAWGIGYGAVDIAPSVDIRGEPHQQQPYTNQTQVQVPSHLRTTGQVQDISDALSLYSLRLSSPLSPSLSSVKSSSRSRERKFKFTTDVRSRSRSKSRSPSSSPQTPVDEESLDFYERRRSSGRRGGEEGFLLGEARTSMTRGRSDKMRHADMDYSTTAVDVEDSRTTAVERNGLSETRATRNWSSNA